MKFLCFAYEDEQSLNGLSESEWHRLRQEVLDYVEDLRASGKLIATNALQSKRTAATVQVRNGRTTVTDGPFSEAKEHIGGYFLVDAADRDEALRIAAGWPSARIGTIEVRPIEEELRLERRYD
jgi:hypothetical protein